MNCGTSTDTEIQEIADTLLADARAGITRPTLYRNHPVVVERFRAASRTPAAASPTSARIGHDTQVCRDHPQRPGHDEPG